MDIRAEAKAGSSSEPSLFGIHKRIESARMTTDRILRLLDGIEGALFGDKVDLDKGSLDTIAGSAGAIPVTYLEAELTDRSTNQIEARLERFIVRLEISGAVDARMNPSTEIK